MTKLILATLTALVLVTASHATPGAVDKQGCHSKPRHCHSANEISTSKKRRYVAFGEG